MDKRLWSRDTDFVRASGYECGSEPGGPAVVDFVRVAAFVLNMPKASRIRDRRKEHWELWGYDLI